MKRTENHIHRAPARRSQTQSIGKNLSSLLYGWRGQVEGELREVKWHAQGHSGLRNTSGWPERLEEAWERTLRRSLWRIHHHGIVMCIQERNVAHKGGNKNGWKGTEDKQPWIENFDTWLNLYQIGFWEKKKKTNFTGNNREVYPFLNPQEEERK